jgi:hypothetical protein
MVGINGGNLGSPESPLVIRNVTATSFEIGDASRYGGAYTGHGVVTRVKRRTEQHYRTLRECVTLPHVGVDNEPARLLNVDGCKPGRPELLHMVFQG